MAETVIRIGEGRPAKPSFGARVKEKARTAFTFKGNEEAWRQKHAKEIEELTAINTTLTDEDRAQAMEKLEKRIQTSAKLRVIRNYGMAALVTSAVAGEGLLIANYKGWADTLAKKKYIGFVGKQALGIRGGIDGVAEKINQFRSEVRTRAVELRERGKARMGTNHNNTARESLESLMPDADKFPLPTIYDITFQTKHEVLDSITNRLSEISSAFNIGQTSTDSNNSISFGKEVRDTQAAYLAKALVHGAVTRNGDWQPLIFHQFEDGSIGWIDAWARDFGLKAGWWEDGLKWFTGENMADQIDLGNGNFALVIRPTFTELIKKIIAKRS